VEASVRTNDTDDPPLTAVYNGSLTVCVDGSSTKLGAKTWKGLSDVVAADAGLDSATPTEATVTAVAANAQPLKILVGRRVDSDCRA